MNNIYGPSNIEIIFDFLFANIKGIYIPRFDLTNLDYFLYGLLFTFLLIYFFNSYAKKLRNNTGKQLPNISISFLLLLLVAAWHSSCFCWSKAGFKS